MCRLLIFTLLLCAPVVTHAQTIDQKVERMYECAERQQMIIDWDFGKKDQILRKYGSFAESIVKSARFIQHMRIEDPDAPEGFRYHCPEEYHIEQPNH